MEYLKEIWIWIASVLGGVSLASIITAVIYGCLKGGFNKAVAKINVEKISEDATAKGIEKIKQVSFTQSLQPIVESQLKKITESANEYISTELQAVQRKYDSIILVLEKLSAYFDNSIGVTESSKKELKEALAEAHNSLVTEQTIKVEEIPEETKKVAQSENNAVVMDR